MAYDALAGSQTPAKLMEEKCASSGLTKDHIKRLGLVALTPEQMQRESDKFDCAPAMCIPYFDFDGSTTDFARYRYLAPPLGFGAALAKPRRYVQLPGSKNEVYMPPLLEQSWRQIAEDPQQELLITEGELKAACACSIGVTTLALGGVQMFSRLSEAKELLPQLKQFTWKDRIVHIVFDSDAATNVDVRKAQLRLANTLTENGARVHIIEMPPSTSGGKQGLDDYLVAAKLKARAAETLRQQHGYPLTSAEALHEFNEQFVYIREVDQVGVLATGVMHATTTFVKSAYANRSYRENVPKADGEEKLVVKRTAKEWMEWGGRAEVSGVCYSPGEPRIYRDNFNRWNGWAFNPKAGDAKPWKDLLAHVFRGDKAVTKWFEQWCAYPMQNPGVKMQSYVLLWGAQGSGKTLIGKTLGDIYGGTVRPKGPQPDNPRAKNFATIVHSDLSDGRREWAADKQFVMGEEATSADNRRDDAETIKALVTQEELRINKKYVQSYSVEDCINYYFTSNHCDSFKLEDDDRRAFVWEVPQEVLTPEFFNAYGAWRDRGGARALFHHLLSVDLTGFNPNEAPPRTASKEQMIKANKSDLAQWVALLREDPMQALEHMAFPAREKAELLNVEQLISAYDWEGTKKITKKYMGKELRMGGILHACGSSPARTVKGQQQLYAIRNCDEWVACRSPKKMADHWDRMFGGQFAAKARAA